MINPQWQEKMSNLLHRREAGDIKPQALIDDYKRHLYIALEKRFIEAGDTILDIGCGSCSVKRHLEAWGWKGKYIGIDAFPIPGSEAIEGKIEYLESVSQCDTCICFAVLDGVEDLELSLSNINAIARKNIFILTGIGIEPDKCHTFKIELDILNKAFSNFVLIYCEPLHPKVYLLNYAKNIY